MRTWMIRMLMLGCVPGCGDAAHAATASQVEADKPATQAAPPVAPVAAPVVAPVTAASREAVLEPGRGQEVGQVFEAWLSPHQEGGEEEETPKTTPKVFRSTTPSQSRSAREAAGHRGHGQVRFTRDMSRAFVDVKVEGVNPGDINMFHIHCGRPGILGPILLDFAVMGDLQAEMADGVLSLEVRNEHIVKTAEHGHGVVGAFAMGCVIPSPSLGSVAPVKVSTIAGMAALAAEGELYFNLHTTGQTYFGDIRGQIHPQR